MEWSEIINALDNFYDTLRTETNVGLLLNKQLHNDKGLPYLSTWISNQFKNFDDISNKPKKLFISKLAVKPSNQD